MAKTRKIINGRLNVRGALAKLQNLLNSSGFPMSLAYPPYEKYELDEAMFTANDLIAQLSKPKGLGPGSNDDDKANATRHAARQRALVSVIMFQMTVGGILELFRSRAARAKAGGAVQNVRFDIETLGKSNEGGNSDDQIGKTESQGS